MVLQIHTYTLYTDQGCYELEQDCFSVYGFEYKPGFDGAYISWIANSKVAWTLMQGGMAADTAVEIGPRPVPQEPMVSYTRTAQKT
jgi:beta-glucan synthesis-associated protein KRE6